MKIKATQENCNLDKKVTLLLRYQFFCFIKDFSYSKSRILFFVNIWSQKWHQTREVTRCNFVYDFFRCVTLFTSNLCFFKFYINLLMKIHENFNVKGIFHDDKSKKMKVYTRIYLVSFSGLQNFVPLETNAFTFSVSIYF